MRKWMIRTPVATLAVLLVGAMLAVGLAACGDDEGDTTKTTDSATKATQTDGKKQPSVPTIVVRNGEPVGGVQELEYSSGEEVRFDVRSDAAYEIHVHGYDVEEEVKPNGIASFDFPADIEGIFEVELHGAEAQIAELRVNP